MENENQRFIEDQGQQQQVRRPLEVLFVFSGQETKKP